LAKITSQTAKNSKQRITVAQIWLRSQAKQKKIQTKGLQWHKFGQDHKPNSKKFKPKDHSGTNLAKITSQTAKNSNQRIAVVQIWLRSQAK